MEPSEGDSNLICLQRYLHGLNPKLIRSNHPSPLGRMTRYITADILYTL